MLGMIGGAGSSIATWDGTPPVLTEHFGEYPDHIIENAYEQDVFETKEAHHYTQELQLEQELFERQLFAYEAPYISENRRNFLYLMESSYSNNLLKQRFRELFGDSYSGEYIFNNYRSIFGLEEDEMIDSAFLRVISGYQVDFRFQNAGDHGRQIAGAMDLHLGGAVVDSNGRVLIFSDSHTSDVAERDLTDLTMAALDISEFHDMLLERMLSLPIPEIYADTESFDLQVSADVNEQRTEAFTNSGNLVSLDFVSRTTTSVTFDVWYANNNPNFNLLDKFNPGTSGWTRLLYRGSQPAALSQRYTATNLVPNVPYLFVGWAFNQSNGQWATYILEPPNFPPLQLTLFSRSSVDFRLDRTFIDALGTDAFGITLRNNFLDATNEAFYILRDFVGGSQFYTGGRMEIRNTRGLPRYTEGWSGWPIFWQLHDAHNDRHLYAIDHAHRMRATGVETTEIPIHEIGHNFDNYRWSFETEALAVFFTYHYYSVTGRSMVNAGNTRTFRGNEFRTYMRNYAYRGLGQINHNEAMRRGVYSSYSMAYMLGNIAGRTGWQAFTNTFVSFHNLLPSQIPTTDIGKLNLFLSFLRHHSGVDVISIIPANARNIYQNFFGGTIQYVAIPVSRTVSFNANGGNPTPAARVVANNSTLGTLPMVTRSNFTFAGWWTAASGGTQIFNNTPITANMTLVARWTANVSVTLTFNGNGGTPATSPITRQSGTTIGTLPANPTRAGFTFAGWFNTSAATGGTQITANTVVPTANTTYWARWTANIVNINSVTIAGTPRVGSQLVVEVTFTGEVANPVLAFQWQRYAGNNVWVDISGARSQTYVPTSADANGFVRVVVSGTGTNVSTTQRISAWVRIQEPLVGLAGNQVIECFDRRGYLNVGSLTTTTIECVGANNAQRPIWVFVHIAENIYAIRNETTGRYMTDTGVFVSHEARLSGAGLNYDNRQRWNLVAQNDGSFRIRSVSSPVLYIMEIAHTGLNTPLLMLSMLNTSHNRQRWWIGPIWHSVDSSVVGFWSGRIDIYTSERDLGQPDGFDFSTMMAEARNAWSGALGVPFNTVSTAADANIRAYGGDRRAIQAYLERRPPFPDIAGVAIPGAHEIVETIYAGGRDRTVARFTGRGDDAYIMVVFSGSIINPMDRARTATMHELGHVLGYWGHSPNSNDVMYGVERILFTNTVLNPAEIEHLRQIYRMFR